MKNLLDLPSSELKKIDKETIHEGYKQVLEIMLMDFYIDCINSPLEIDTLEDLNLFIKKWVKKRITTPHQDWNPGDVDK